MKPDSNMNWTTLYITGRTDFRDDVHRKLDGSPVDFMPGYIESTGNGVHDLIWINEKATLREIKEAIGGKLIWKYRLRFYTNLEDFIQSVNGPAKQRGWTNEELDLLAAMRQSA